MVLVSLMASNIFISLINANRKVGDVRAVRCRRKNDATVPSIGIVSPIEYLVGCESSLSSEDLMFSMVLLVSTSCERKYFMGSLLFICLQKSAIFVS